MKHLAQQQGSVSSSSSSPTALDVICVSPITIWSFGRGVAKKLNSVPESQLKEIPYYIHIRGQTELKSRKSMSFTKQCYDFHEGV